MSNDLVPRRAALSLAERLARHRVSPPVPVGRAMVVPRRPPLELDLDGWRAAGFATPQAPPSALVQAIRILRCRLLAVSHVRTVMVTSPGGGEGKTFAAVNLALGLCGERSLQVVVVDADGHRQGAGRLFGGTEPPGLADLLDEDSTLETADALRHTSIPNLAFLPSGNPRPHTAELMSGRRMGRVLRDLASRSYDRTLVIVDTPPVLESAEAASLSMHVDRGIVIVRNGETKMNSLCRSLDMLQGCPAVDCILNMADIDVYGSDGYG